MLVCSLGKNIHKGVLSAVGTARHWQCCRGDVSLHNSANISALVFVLVIVLNKKNSSHCQGLVCFASFYHAMTDSLTSIGFERGQNNPK